MALSRKRAKELKKLKASASDLWDTQKDVLEHAADVVREAGRQAGNYSREEVAPRVKDTLDNRVRPTVASGVSAARSAADDARSRFQPGVSSALASALAVLEVTKDPNVREALARVSKAGNSIGVKAGIVQPKKSSGVLKYILIGVALVGVAGVAYAAWQTLRADDELWVSEDLDEPDAVTPKA